MLSFPRINSDIFRFSIGSISIFSSTYIVFIGLFSIFSFPSFERRLFQTSEDFSPVDRSEVAPVTLSSRKNSSGSIYFWLIFASYRFFLFLNRYNFL